MKTYIKKTALSLTVICSMAIVTSCDKDFGNINDPWDNKQYSVTVPGLYNSIVSGMGETGRGLASSFIYQASQLAANYAASGYRLDNMVGGTWDNYYYALADYRKAVELIDASPDAAKMKNMRAMLQTLIALKTLRATVLYGDIPYSQAAMSMYGPDYYRPVYDKQADVFVAALGELKQAIDSFSTGGDQISMGASETLLKNDIALWIKFANSVRLRYAMVMRDKNASVADGIIAEALGKPLLGPDEYIGLDPKLISGLIIDRAGSYRGNAYVRMGSTMWNAMSSSSDEDGADIYDLRAPIFFEPNSAGKWKPYPQNPPANVEAETRNDTEGGRNDPYAAVRLNTWAPAGTYYYSPLNIYYVADQTIPDLIITGAEVSFLRAEIANRGIGGAAANPATAKQHYEAGITGSINFWYKIANGSAVWTVNKPTATPDPEDLAEMLAHPAVAYSATPAAALTQIYKQNWIALFHQPLDAWTLQRRTGSATPSVPLAPTSEALNLNRLTYPSGEVTSNFDNWRAVTGGTDNKSVKPWYMP
jgi:hypothetical protein